MIEILTHELTSVSKRMRRYARKGGKWAPSYLQLLPHWHSRLFSPPRRSQSHCAPSLKLPDFWISPVTKWHFYVFLDSPHTSRRDISLSLPCFLSMLSSRGHILEFPTQATLSTNLQASLNISVYSTSRMATSIFGPSTHVPASQRPRKAPHPAVWPAFGFSFFVRVPSVNRRVPLTSGPG